MNEKLDSNYEISLPIIKKNNHDETQGVSVLEQEKEQGAQQLVSQPQDTLERSMLRSGRKPTINLIMQKSSTGYGYIQKEATLINEQCLERQQELSFLTKKEQYLKPQQIFMEVVSTNFGVPVIQPVKLTNGVYIPTSQSMIVHARMSGMVMDKLLLESNIRQIITWFSGCNSIWAVMVLVNLSITISDILNLGFQNIIDLTGEDGNSLPIQISNYIFLIEYLIWLTSIIVGIYGLAKFKNSYFQFYTIGIKIVFICDCTARIIVICSKQFWNIAYKYRIRMMTLWGITSFALFFFLHYSSRLQRNIKKWYNQFG